MAIASWPGDLPFLCSLRELSREGARGATRAFMPDAGPFKIRRVTRAGYKPLAGRTPVLTEAQRTRFLNFWEGDLSGGVLSFSALHPMTGAICVFQSDGTPYSDIMVAPGKYRISLTLVELP